MFTKPTRSQLLELTPGERIQLVEEIWDSLADLPGNIPVTDAQREELDVRLRRYSADPTAGSTWEDVKSRIRQR